MTKPTHGFSRWGCLLTEMSLCALSLVWSGSTVLAIESETAVVDIHSRAFLPHRLLLHHGRPTVLAIKNHDTELHAFVPAELLSGVNVNVSGNGAPEFGSQGFKRGIIPPDGVMEIQFTPERRGEFPYVCDMPGHQMTATIVVE